MGGPLHSFEMQKGKRPTVRLQCDLLEVTQKIPSVSSHELPISNSRSVSSLLTRWRLFDIFWHFSSVLCVSRVATLCTP